MHRNQGKRVTKTLKFVNDCSVMGPEVIDEVPVIYPDGFIVIEIMVTKQASQHQSNSLSR